MALCSRRNASAASGAGGIGVLLGAGLTVQTGGALPLGLLIGPVGLPVAAPPLVALLVVLPLAWRVTAEARGWKPLPGALRHSLTVLALLVLIVGAGFVDFWP